MVDAARKALTVSTLQLMPVVLGLRVLGVDAERVLAEVGIAPSSLGDLHQRVPRELALALWQAAREASGDPGFPLRVAEQVEPGMFDVIDYVARSSATLRAALGRVSQYGRLLDDVCVLLIEDSEEECIVRHGTLHGVQMPVGVSECLFAGIVRVVRQLAEDETLDPLAVRFTAPAPRDTSTHQRMFRCPVHFGAAADELVYARWQTERPLPTADERLCAILDRHAQALLRGLPPVGGFANRVRSAIAEELRGGNPSLSQVAESLKVSERTLRRRLREEGTSHQELLDALRRDLALRYLDENALSIDEVAYQLGFSQSSAFRRAFKRWTGQTPGQHRGA